VFGKALCQEMHAGSQGQLVLAHEPRLAGAHRTRIAHVTAPESCQAVEWVVGSDQSAGALTVPLPHVSLSSKHCDEVRCSAVQALTLMNCAISAANPINLSTLTALTSLDLTMNRRVHARPNWDCIYAVAEEATCFSCLAVVSTLCHTKKCLCMRSRGQDVVASLAGLTRLRSLNLSNDSVTAEQLEAAAPLAAQHLTKLGLAKNALKILPAFAAAMTSLADLDLSDNSLTALPPGPYLGAFEQTLGQVLKLAYASV